MPSIYEMLIYLIYHNIKYDELKKNILISNMMSLKRFKVNKLRLPTCIRQGLHLNSCKMYVNIYMYFKATCPGHPFVVPIGMCSRTMIRQRNAKLQSKSMITIRIFAVVRAFHSRTSVILVVLLQ